MSFARFGPDSDVYLFFNTGGWLECCACILRKRDVRVQNYLENLGQVLAHLRAHVAEGHKVPEELLTPGGWWEPGFEEPLDTPFVEEFGARLRIEQRKLASELAEHEKKW